MSLIEKLMSFFTHKNNTNEVKLNGDKPKDEKKLLDELEKPYLTDTVDGATTMQNDEISMLSTWMKRYFVFGLLDGFLNHSQTQKDFISTFEQWVWVLYLRGPDQVGLRYDIVVLCYNKFTLDVLSNEKLIPNVSLNIFYDEKLEFISVKHNLFFVMEKTNVHVMVYLGLEYLIVRKIPESS